MKKKLMAVLLTLCLVLGMLPMSALAAWQVDGEDVTITNIRDTDVNGYYAFDLDGTTYYTFGKLDATGKENDSVDYYTYYSASDFQKAGTLTWKAEATEYTITVTEPENGTVATNPEGKAAEGTEVAITATPATGYKVGTTTVTAGETNVTVTDGKFTMPAANVTVTVTFKKTASEGSIVVSPKGTALAENHYSMTGLDANNEIAIGETFTINALKKIVVYVDGVRTVVEKDDTFDVTAAEDLSVVINRTKWAPGENNSLTEVEDTNSDTPAATPSMARFARAIRAAVEYQKMIITDVDGKAHEYIVKVETGADGMRTIYFPSAKSVAEAADILNAADEANKEAEMDFETATDKEIEDNWGEEPVNPEVIVKSTTTKANTGWTATFTKYIPEDLADDETLVLTKAEVEKALAEEHTGTWTADLKKGEAVRASDKQVVKFTANPSATQVFMVTYPGAAGKVSIYVNPGDPKTATVENVNADVKYLLAKDDVYAAAAAYTVAEQKVTFTGVTEDVEYVAALMLDSSDADYAVSAGEIKNKKAEDKDQAVLEAKIKKSAVTFVPLDKTTTAFVQTGTVITFAQGADVKTGVDALKAGEGVKLEVNGSSTPALEFVASDKGVIETKEWTVPAKAKNSTLSFKAIREPVDQEISVYLNDSTTALPTETIDKKVYVKVGSVNIGDGTQYSVVYWDDVAEKYDLVNTKIGADTVKVDTAGVARIERGALNAIATTDANGNKVAKIYTAYSVAPGSAWDGYLENPNDETKNVTAVASTAYVPTTNAKIWVKATGNALLMDKDGTAELTGRIVPAPTVDGTVRAVYEYPVAKNLVANNIVPALTFASTTVAGALNVDLKAGVESSACTITGLTIGTAGQKIKLDLGSAVTVNGATGSLEDAGDVTFTLKQNKGTGAVEFTAKSVNDAPRSLKAETNVGKAYVTINGVNVIIDISRDARTSTNNTEIVAFVKEQFEKMNVAPIAKAEPVKGETDVKTAVAQAVTANSIFDAPFNSVHNTTADGFSSGIKVETVTAVANGTKGEATEAGTRGEYKVSYALKSGDVEGVATITVYIEPMPYSETAAGQAEAAALAKINAVKDTVLDADNGLKELGATAATKDDALGQLKTDVGGIITGLSSEVTGVSVKSATAEDSGFTAPADPDKGRLTATVTLACTGCDDVSFTVTVTIPVS